MNKTISFILDNKNVEAQPGESIRQCAERVGTKIPGMCSGLNAHYPDDGSCRLCMVEIEGERTLAASCKRHPTPGMKVATKTDRATKARTVVMELLLTDRPIFDDTPYQPAERFEKLASNMGVNRTRFTPRAKVPYADDTHPAIDVHMSKCILCTNCVRACRDVQGNDVIGIAGRGKDARIVFDQGDAMGFSSCVGCGECVQACPTGALLPKGLPDETGILREVDSLCPYCGVGCQVRYHTNDAHIMYTDGRDGPANKNRLCVKGRFGFDYARHPDRLTHP